MRPGLLLPVLLATVTTPLVPAKATGDWDELYSVMETALQVMDRMDAQWTDLMASTISQIGNMADRIVSTEGLINKEGLEIGRMSDRIVATEAILRNMTAHCLRCSHPPPDTFAGSSPAHAQRRALIVRAPMAFRSPSPTCFTCEMTGLRAQQTRHGEGRVSIDTRLSPVTGLLALMNHTLVLMETMSGEVTAEMAFMERQIGVMADRIVGTECLIMNMSSQIGTMSDRIVHTEEMLSSVCTACCHIVPAPMNADSWSPASRPATCNNSLSPSPSAATPISLEQMRIHLGRPGVSGSDCAPWDFVCLAVKAMTGIAERMEDTMYSMCSDMLNQTAAGALEVGRLADQIVGMEHQIIDMGLVIGKMADQIVAVEAAMLGFAQSFCHLGGRDNVSRETSWHPPVWSRHIAAIGPEMGLVQAVHVSARRLQEIANRADALQQASMETLGDVRTALDEMPRVLEHVMQRAQESGSIVNPLKWVDLMRKMMAEMAAMSGRMLTTMSRVMKGIGDMSMRILETTKLMGQMAGQIQAMSGRIVSTMEMVNGLVKECRPRSHF